MYPSFLKPCISCFTRRQLAASLASISPIHSSASVSPAHSVESTSSSNTETNSKQSTKTFSDSSSDSGYDESSNQYESKLAKNVQIKEDAEMEESVSSIELEQLSNCKSLQTINVSNQSLQSVSN